MINPLLTHASLLSDVFDDGFSPMFHAKRWSQTPSYPPADILTLGDNEYRVEMNVAGYSEAEMSLTVDNGYLVVKGEKKFDDRTHGDRSIVRKSFERSFRLGFYTQVVGARLENGILSIDLEKVIPEEMKPRSIAISTTADKPRLVASN